MKFPAFLFLLFFTISASAGGIKVPSHAPKIGKRNGQFQIVEFFDYRCGYCKKMVPVLDKTLKNHKNAEVVFIELPIFGEASEFMAKSALAVKTLKASKYFDYHSALMRHRGKFNDDSIRTVASKLGLNGEDIIKEMKKKKYDGYLRDNSKLANKRQVRGTPHLVVEGSDVRGFIDYDKLDQYLALQGSN